MRLGLARDRLGIFARISVTITHVCDLWTQNIALHLRGGIITSDFVWTRTAELRVSSWLTRSKPLGIKCRRKDALARTLFGGAHNTYMEPESVCLLSLKLFRRLNYEGPCAWVRLCVVASVCVTEYVCAC